MCIVNGRHHRIFLNWLNNNIPTSIIDIYYDKSNNSNNNNDFALRNHNKMRNNIFQVSSYAYCDGLMFPCINCDVTHRRDVY